MPKTKYVIEDLGMRLVADSKLLGHKCFTVTVTDLESEQSVGIILSPAERIELAVFLLSGLAKRLCV